MLSSLAWLSQAVPLFHMRTPIDYGIIRAVIRTFPRMQSPFSGGFRMIAALRSPLSISRIVPRSAFALSVVKERVRRTERLCKSMQTNPLTHRRTPVFIGVFAHSTFFHVEHSAQNPAFGAVSHSDEFRGMEQRATRHARAHAPTRHTPAHMSARQRANAHAPTHAHAHPCARTHAHTRVTHARTRMHTRARSHPQAASEPNGNWRHLCARSKCKANVASAFVFCVKRAMQARGDE